MIDNLPGLGQGQPDVCHFLLAAGRNISGEASEKCVELIAHKQVP